MSQLKTTTGWDQCCNTCRFYKPVEGLKKLLKSHAGGWCRRLPPVVVSGTAWSAHPPVHPVDWCGEFQENPDLEERG